jgi:hypothetical protein
VRHQVFDSACDKRSFTRALDAHQARAELVLGQLAHGTHAAIAEVVDVVDLAAPLRRSTRILMTATMSSLDSVPCP